MAKCASSSSAGASVAKKANVVTKQPVKSSSDKNTVKDKPKASSSGRKNSTKQEASPNKADTNNENTSKAIKRPLTAAQLKAEQKMGKEYDKELDEYTVECILDKDIPIDGVTKYKVKWLNYPDDECTWEDVHSLANSMKHVLEWEREEGQNWQLEPYPLKYDNAMRSIAIREEYRRLTCGNYRIKEKYGIANGHTWYLMERWNDGDEQVLCLKDGDHYYEKMNVKEYDHVMEEGAWDNVPNKIATEQSPMKTPKVAKGKK